MNSEYRKYVNECWVFAREVCMNDLKDVEGDYDQDIILAIFDKVCQPYHYWNKGRKLN